MIRTLFKADLPDILAIEKAVHISPWNEETFKICFQSGYIGWVLEIEGKTVGFIMISQSREEIHILNVCVTHAYQHQGLGYKLMREALNHAKRHAIGIAYLEVRRSNTHAITLYRKMGFHYIGERKEYYPSPTGNEDALIFAMSLHTWNQESGSGS